MSTAPTPPPHTPVLIVKAGGDKNFDDDCEAALIKMGFHPDDFGTHREVKRNIKEAQRKREDYVAQCEKEGVPPDPDKPDPRTVMLAKSQSGHLNQDALFRTGTREDACSNNSPPEGDGRGFRSADAPCMPMQTMDTPEGGAVIGSPHWAVGRNEQRQWDAAKNSGNPVMDDDQLSKNAQENIKIALGRNPNSRYSNAIKKLPEEEAKTGRKKRGEAADRRDAAADIQQDAAKQLQEQGGAGAKSKDPSQADINKAVECIENFRKRKMDEMRTNAIEKYGRNYDDTKKKLEAQVAAKQKEVDALKAKLEGPPKPRGNNRKKLERQLEDARSDRNDAQGELRDLPCLNQQARSLAGRQPTAQPTQIRGPVVPPGPFQGFAR